MQSFFTGKKECSYSFFLPLVFSILQNSVLFYGPIPRFFFILSTILICKLPLMFSGIKYVFVSINNLGTKLKKYLFLSQAVEIQTCTGSIATKKVYCVILLPHNLTLIMMHVVTPWISRVEALLLDCLAVIFLVLLNKIILRSQICTLPLVFIFAVFEHFIQPRKSRLSESYPNFHSALYS